jgi:putative inorganic carbon (HCO3(-)) transporter
MSQFIFFIFIIIVINVSFFFNKDKKKVLLGYAIFTAPWQGGLWLRIITTDLLLSTILFLIVFGIILFEPAKGYNKIHKGVLYPAMGMFVISIVSGSMSVDPTRAFVGTYIVLMEYVAFFCIYNYIRKPSDVKFVTFALMAALVFQSILGLLQFKFIHFKIGIIDEVSWMWWRANGTFTHPNHLGMYLILILPILFRQGLMALRDNKKKQGYQYLTAFFLGCGALVASQSRGSWIGFGFAMIMLHIIDFARNRSKIRKVIIRLSTTMIILFTLFMAKYGGFFMDRLLRSNASNIVQGREELQKEAIPIIMSHPIFGVGWGNYRHYMGSVSKMHEFVHNLYLLIPAEWGFPGLIFFLWLIVIWSIEIKKSGNKRMIYLNNLSMAIRISLIGFLIASIPGPDYFIDQQVGTHLWILIGVSAGLNKIAERYSVKNVERLITKNRIQGRGGKLNIAATYKRAWAKIV